MSCDWDVWCLDCEEGLGLSDWNHKSDAMLDIIRARDALAALADVRPDAYASGFEYWGSYKDLVPVGFFAKHRGHRLIPRDEYGQCLDECGETIVCSHCKLGNSRCRLPEKHEGPHAAERRTNE